MSAPCCPKCGGLQGFQYIRTERSCVTGNWTSGAMDEGSDGFFIDRSMPQCLECGQKFRWETVDKVRGGDA